MSYMRVAIAIAAISSLIFVFLVFNRLVRLRNRVAAGWADIDVQLKLRHDLIPGVMNSVRTYMDHERSILESVTEARTQAMNVGHNVLQRASAEAALTGALGNLIVSAERYPELRADQNMKVLQEELQTAENRIAFARQFYNKAVMQYNIAQYRFPTNLLAGMLGFQPAAMFSTSKPEDYLGDDSMRA